MSELSIHNTDTSLLHLKGQNNFLQWSQDFKVITQLKDVWEIIIGTEAILTKPAHEQYISSMGKYGVQIRSKTTMTVKKQETLCNKITGQVQLWKLNMEEYEQNHKQVHLASALILYYVDLAICEKLQSYITSAEQWTFIKDQYKMQDTHALEIVLNHIKKLWLSTCTSVQDYINKLEMHKQNIINSKGEYSDNQLMTKIVHELTSQYNLFIDQYHFLQDTEGLTALNFKGLTSKLLSFKSKIHKHTTKDKTVNTVNQDRKHKEQSKDKCIKPKCGKWGHKEENCFIAHPELKKKKEQKLINATEKKDEDTFKIKHLNKVTVMATVNLDHFKDLMNSANTGDIILKPCMSIKTSSSLEPTDWDSQNCDDRSEIDDDSEKEKNIFRHGNKRATVSSSIFMLDKGKDQHSRNKWIIDFSTNLHLANDKKWFTEFRPIKYSVKSADGKDELTITEGGKVELVLVLPDNFTVELELITVAYTPSVQCNILSLSLLGLSGGLNREWSSDAITIHIKSGHLIDDTS